MIIGFAGPAGSGKDTAAWLLWSLLRDQGKRFKYGERETSFATPMKETLAALFPELKEKFYNDKGHIVQPYGISIRKIMQTFAAEWARNIIDDNFWVDRHRQRWLDINIIVGDVRFPNEAAYVRANGVLVHVDRPVLRIDESGHASEQALDRLAEDHVVDNYGSIDDLKIRVAQLIRNVFTVDGVSLK